MAPDPRFFGRARPLTVGALAEAVGAALGSGADGARVLTGVGPLDAAGPSDLSFLDNPRYRAQLPATRAGAVLLAPKEAAGLPPGTAALVTPEPYRAYARAAALLYPPEQPDPGVHPAAVVDATAVLGAGVRVEACAVIGAGAEIGAHSWIEAGAIVGPRVILGERVRIGAGASVSHAIIGARTRLYPGARIGQDGFGFAMGAGGHVKVPQLGRVLIGADAEIGANTCIDRGAGPDTIIGDGVWIDNLVQVGHNVTIGRGAVIVAQAGISGSSKIGDLAAIGGQAGVAGHLTVGAGARVAAQSGLMRDVPEGAEVIGSPALPLRRFMRQTALLARMTEGK